MGLILALSDSSFCSVNIIYFVDYYLSRCDLTEVKITDRCMESESLLLSNEVCRGHVCTLLMLIGQRAVFRYNDIFNLEMLSESFQQIQSDLQAIDLQNTIID